MIPNRNAYEYSTRDSTPLVIEGGGGSEGEYNISFTDVTFINSDAESNEISYFGHGSYLTNYINEDAGITSEKEFITTDIVWVKKGHSKTYKLPLLNGIGIVLVSNGVNNESISIDGNAEFLAQAAEEGPDYIKVTGPASIAYESPR